MTGSGYTGWLALVLFGASATVQADSEALQWLARMSRAAQSINYTGTFVYQHQGKLASLNIVHAGDEGGERERLWSLTGARREVLRDGRTIVCILGDRNTVHVQTVHPGTPFQVDFPREWKETGKYYRFEVGGRDRVADRGCRVVSVTPLDRMRYARRYCIDEARYLWLRSDLVDPDGRVIEQMMFTKLDFPAHIDARTLQPELEHGGFSRWRTPEHKPESGNSANASRWQISQLPPGFMLTDHGQYQRSATESVGEQWMYSDGLASVSVYIEPSSGRDDYGGMTHQGALNVYATMLGGYYVTVVGDVPRKTVEIIGRSIRIR